MPTKRWALLAWVCLLAACSPQAGRGTADGVEAADAVQAAPPPDSTAAVPADAEASDAPATAEPDTATALAADAEADDSADMPDLAQLEHARAQAGCKVSNDVGTLADIRIYCTMPADVRAFLERENTCQHFAGEEPYDDARRAELEAASAEFCDGREQRFEALYERHFDDCAIRHALIGVGKRYDLFTTTAPDYCRPQDVH